jgi:hypothetical protein
MNNINLIKYLQCHPTSIKNIYYTNIVFIIKIIGLSKKNSKKTPKYRTWSHSAKRYGIRGLGFGSTLAIQIRIQQQRKWQKLHYLSKPESGFVFS